MTRQRAAKERGQWPDQRGEAASGQSHDWFVFNAPRLRRGAGVGKRPQSPEGAECPESPGLQSYSLAHCSAGPPSLGLPSRKVAWCPEEGSLSLGCKWEKGPSEGTGGWTGGSGGLGHGLEMFSSENC